MEAVKAYYDGHAFIPVGTLSAKKNQTAIVTILDDIIAPTGETQSNKLPVFGCAKGRFHIPDDFDVPLEDFAGYMQ
jgi:hypothetical protein